MELLVAVVQHQSYGSRGRSQIADGFISSPSMGFKGINCRTFQSDIGILPVPSHEIEYPVSPLSRKQRSATFYSEPSKQLTGPRCSSPIPISPRPTMKVASFKDELSDSERWAGPAYSNSPPPSSLPIPKFSLCQRCSISIELPVLSSGDKIPSLVKSAPSLPNRGSFSSASDSFFNTKSATKDLRRILHLDIADD